MLITTWIGFSAASFLQSRGLFSNHYQHLCVTTPWGTGHRAKERRCEEFRRAKRDTWAPPQWRSAGRVATSPGIEQLDCTHGRNTLLCIDMY